MAHQDVYFESPSFLELFLEVSQVLLQKLLVSYVLSQTPCGFVVAKPFLIVSLLACYMLLIPLLLVLFS